MKMSCYTYVYMVKCKWYMSLQCIINKLIVEKRDSLRMCKEIKLELKIFIDVWEMGLDIYWNIGQALPFYPLAIYCLTMVWFVL